MRPDLKERRERTWWLLNVVGQRYTDVVDHVSEEFDCAESTIERDISKMGEWLPELDPEVANNAMSIVMELKRSRQRRWEMVEAARAQNKPDVERDLLNDIDHNAERYLTLLGEIDMIADDTTTSQDFTITHELSDQEFVTLERMTRETREATTPQQGAAAVDDGDDGEGERWTDHNQR